MASRLGYGVDHVLPYEAQQPISIIVPLLARGGRRRDDDHEVEITEGEDVLAAMPPGEAGRVPADILDPPSVAVLARGIPSRARPRPARLVDPGWRYHLDTSRFMMLPHRDDDTTLRGTASLEVEEQAAQKTDGREHNPAARRPARACLLHACRVDVGLTTSLPRPPLSCGIRSSEKGRLLCLVSSARQCSRLA
jgi:hypothetical protein